MTLTWNYSLTADERANSNLLYRVKWFKFNSLSLLYTEIASYTIFDGESFNEPNHPRIVADRPIANDSATLVINDVQGSDEGLYKIEYRLLSGKINESGINLIVLGKLLFLYCEHHINVSLHLHSCYL